jgi:hypothetical protein
MKNNIIILNIIFLFFFISNVFAHDKSDFIIKEKTGKEYEPYNFLIKKFNNYVNKNDFPFFSSECKNMPKSPEIAVDKIDCIYGKIKTQMGIAGISVGDIPNIAHDHYLNIRNRAIRYTERWYYNRSNFVNEVNDYVDYLNSSLEQMHLAMKNEFINEATRVSIKYYNSENKKKNSGLLVQLEKLDQMYRTGTLTKDQFDKAKDLLLNK